MKRFFLFVLLLLPLFANLTFAQESNGVSETRFARLQRGINLPFWFWYGPEEDTAIAEYFTDEDFAQIRELGFTFVRVPITLDFVMDESAPDLLNADHLALLDAAIEQLLAHDLAVMVDLHSTTLDTARYPNIFSGRMEAEPEFIDTYIQFWAAFAAHLRPFDPERVFLEPMNEPVFQDNIQAWPPIQERLIAAIRENAPDHTIIATGARWSNLNTLLALEPLDDPNIVYNFHFYEPFWFTHQGADWAGEEAIRLRDIPYPSSPEIVAEVLPRLSESSQDIIAWYGEETWNAEKIDGMIAQAATWGEQHNVRIICNEFGTYKEFAPAEDRVQWITDVRTAFEKYGIGWSMWEYDSSFGLVTRVYGKTIVDAGVAQALGLTLPE